MKTIWKWTVPELGGFDLDMPHGAEVLNVEFQYREEKIVLWAFVDTDRPTERRQFVACFTGKDCGIDLPMKYIGTVQLEGGLIVSHYFEVGRTFRSN